MKGIAAWAVIPILLITSLAGTYAQTTIDRNVLSSGGVEASNALLQLSGTLGQPIIGSTVTLHRATWQGFWYPVAAPTASVPVTGSNTASLRCSPNPISRSATIDVTISQPGHVTLSLHDLLGRTVQTLLDQPHNNGTYSFELETGSLPDGRYTLRCTQASGEQTLPVLVVQ